MFTLPAGPLSSGSVSLVESAVKRTRKPRLYGGASLRCSYRLVVATGYLRTIADDVSDKEYDALCEPITDMEREIMTTPAQSIRGVAVKFRVHVHMNHAPAPWLHEPLDQLPYDRAAIAAIYRNLERLVGEG